ncbi:MAG: AraC family transcriptional regulator [Planctomycetaceae bacterium]|nr:AraC family transcriptional regulator [Planctomycetaceae bacterium]
MRTAHGSASARKGGIVVKSAGVSWFHPGGFVIDRPTGLADFTFVQWLTPTIVRLGGESRLEAPGGCIFYRPGDEQWYGSDIFTPFGNHWFHFTGNDADAIFTACGIPSNQVLRPPDDSFIEPALRLFLKETMSETTCQDIALSAHAALFLVEFARLLRRAEARSHSARNMELRGKFERFRETLRERCTEAWTINRMASELHLSPSRFSTLYREFFDAKPVDDLIRMRMDLAEYYLRTTIMPVNYVANLCGFTDIYYFSRTFKAKTGKTATAYRAETLA